jgi:hypothetical protein
MQFNNRDFLSLAQGLDSNSQLEVVCCRIVYVVPGVADVKDIKESPG